MGSRPAYESLTPIPGTEIPSAWGAYGSDDELGALNLLTDERVAAASALVRTGQRIVLSLPLHEPNPPLFGRQPLRHEVTQPMPAVSLDDKLDDFYPQAGSQWDALAHFGYPEAGFYNGISVDRVLGEGALGIQRAASLGIAGRGVLLDVARHLATRDPSYRPDVRYEISADLLRETAAAQGVTFEEGDIVCVRTGWAGWYKQLDPQARQAVMESSLTYVLALAGLAPAAGIAELAWEEGFALLALDNPTVEPSPIAMGEEGPLLDELCHVRVMVALGIQLGEMFDLEALSEACAADGRYTFLLTSAPLNIHGGMGSPPNVMAIR
jgi:kynurenine formamidase